MPNLLQASLLIYNVLFCKLPSTMPRTRKAVVICVHVVPSY